jgi:PBP1b-binding outer membrane lipoprotein LpoB
MKKILSLSALLFAVLLFTACTRSNTAETNGRASASPQANTATDTKSATTSAVATFAPTSDEDVKAIDKSMDQVNFNDYSDSSLNDLK